MAESNATINIELTKPDWIKEMSIITLTDEDIVVISSPFTLSEFQREKTNRAFAILFPKNDVLTLEGGATIGIVRKESR